MDLASILSINDIFNVYFMYLELYASSLKKHDIESAKNYFHKISQYFDIIYQGAQQHQGEENNKLLQFKKDFDKIKEKAQSALNIDVLTQENPDLDFIENLIKEKSFNELAKFLNENGAKASAVYFFKKVLELNPDNAQNLITLGNYCIDSENYREAIKNFEKYITIDLNKAEIYDIIGVLYSKVDRYDNFDLRINYFEKALSFQPENVDFLRHLAITYRHMGDDKKCLEIFEKIIKLNSFSNDYFDLAIQKLKMGDFEEGLKYYEHRFTRETSTIFYPEISKPKWDGKADLSDKILLVQKEQGHGDSVQFVRYLLDLKAKKVIFRVHDALVDLFKYNYKNIEIVPVSTPIEALEFDYHIALESLMYVLDAKVETIPYPQGYLKADEALVLEYKQKFFDNNDLKIGIAYCGLSGGNDYRNIDLQALIPLSKLPNIKVYSFQKERREELEKYIEQGVDIVNLGATFKDFSDTAAALENIDVLISSDNVVAHLAGAMGKKTILLLNKDSNWRWFMAGEKSPWYNSMAVLRKDFEKQSWIELVKKALGMLQ